MLNLKIKEPDYKALYESRQAKIDSLNKTISGLKGRITRLENENYKLKKGFKGMDIAPSFKVIIDAIKEDTNNLINKTNENKD